MFLNTGGLILIKIIALGNLFLYLLRYILYNSPIELYSFIFILDFIHYFFIKLTKSFCSNDVLSIFLNITIIY